ncbi:MAG TPA: S8 family serine peptidase [Anaerolineae bacterium]|nr:S8 family serine peptidase [Anaerolineae bacterium]HQI83576.1 S8 family serine peptidase [Anaerolineae bacterium]
MNVHPNRLILALLLIVSVLMTANPAPAQATHRETLPVSPSTPGEFKPGEILVRLKMGVRFTTTQRILEQYSVTTIRNLYNSDVQLMRVPEGHELEIAAALNADPGVVYAEPNYIYHAFDLVPNDPNYSKQWAHTTIQSPGAWGITTGNTDIVIAIIDSGVDTSHPDLASKLVAGHDFVDDDNTPSDENGHGTHVAGIAAAVTNNGIGVAGMAWDARIMPVRVLDNKGNGYNSDITAGITWAYQNGADILNLSLGGASYSQTMQDAINAAHAGGSLVVAAMGNCRYATGSCTTANPTQYPAAYNNVMAVAATDSGDSYAYYSQYGSHCDIAAPGGELSRLGDPNGIYSTLPTYAVYMTTYYGFLNNYDYLQGTSQATPYVSGLAALIWSMNPALTPDEVQSLVQQTAEDLGTAGWDQDYGWGRINAYTALATLNVPDPPALNPIVNADGDDSYTVTWSAVPNATEYQLQESSSTSFSTYITRYSGANTQVLVAGREVGVWYYRVRAVNAAGNASAWSNIQSVTVLPAPPVMSPIDNPTNADAYVVQWSSVPGAYSYMLVQDTTPTFTAPITRYIGSAIAYNVTGQPGGTWYYRARATAGSLIGPWSTPVSTTVAPAPLSPPTLTVLSDDRDGDYTLDWSDVSGATVYTLEESLSVYFTNPLVVYAGTPSIYTVTEQTGGQWHYRVRAAGPVGRSPWSTTKTVIVTSYIYLPLTLKAYTPPILSTTIPNGDFESGLTHWSTSSAKGRVVIANTFPSGIAAHSGYWAAWLGGDNAETAYIQRQLAIPSSTPYLRYWHWIDSPDTCGYDFGRVYVNNTLLKTYNLCLAQKTSGWIEQSLDLRAYAGLTVTFSISATTDSTLISNLFIDDLVLKSAP